MFNFNKTLNESTGYDDVVLTNEEVDGFLELAIADECARMGDEERKAFLESDISVAIVEAKKMRKNTLVRLSGDADLERREMLAAMHLAKLAGDSLFDKLAQVRVKERDLLGKIRKKYGTKATKLAKVEQKDYIKNRMKANFATKDTNQFR